ncbi:hypothetical protein GPECTOR_102g72 [Gonium pectorale]|uniref:Uncharacterized protein n=1 Tax=Gonium pectorale TaxID=33097 RepID=A0A150FZU8_GONPE|nr:hypothetical protein GPECTOR_102g72 [Gonium pectorale]|eukprot:KXZ43119.1 hypothetical protein GPECTOR_102g72 [Gonium pectorale]
MSGPSTAVVEGVSGSLGSVIALLATYPLKTIYTLQALSTGGGSHAPAEALDEGAWGRLLATLEFLQTYKLSNLYAGLGPNVVESGLSSGVYFFFYSKLRQQAVAWSRARAAAAGKDASSGGGGGKDVGVLASLLVATAAGALNQLITMPASVVATRIQGYQSLPGAREGRRPPSTWETIASVWREDGVGGFWKGLLPSMILLANPAVQYMLFEKIKALMLLWKEQRLRAAAAAAKAAAAAAAADEELLSRRRSADSDEAIEAAAEAPKAAAARAAAAGGVSLSAGEARVQAASAASAQSGGLRASTWGVIADTARREGAGGFFKGLRAKILQTALNAALMLMLKEQLHGATRSALAAAAEGVGAAVASASAAGGAGAASASAVSAAVKAPSAAG